MSTLAGEPGLGAELHPGLLVWLRPLPGLSRPVLCTGLSYYRLAGGVLGEVGARGGHIPFTEEGAETQ